MYFIFKFLEKYYHQRSLSASCVQRFKSTSTSTLWHHSSKKKEKTRESLPACCSLFLRSLDEFHTDDTLIIGIIHTRTYIGRGFTKPFAGLLHCKRLKIYIEKSECISSQKFVRMKEIKLFSSEKVYYLKLGTTSEMKYRCHHINDLILISH